mgnify:CR=1 FL=1
MSVCVFFLKKKNFFFLQKKKKKNYRKSGIEGFIFFYFNRLKEKLIAKKKIYIYYKTHVLLTYIYLNIHI